MTQLNVPDDIIKMQVEFGRHDHIWFCWILTTTHWYRGRGSTMQMAVDEAAERLASGNHIAANPPDPKPNDRRRKEVTSNEDLSDLF